MPFLETFITEHLAHRGRKMAETRTPEEALARFEELSLLETEFEDVELEISKLPSQCSWPLNANRASPQILHTACASLEKACRFDHKDPTLLDTRLRTSPTRDR